MPTKQKTYTEEFKPEALRLAQERGNLAQTPRDLGVSHTSILSCKTLLEEAPQRPFPGQGNPTDAQLAQLQRELPRLKEEKEILKKAMGSFMARPR